MKYDTSNAIISRAFLSLPVTANRGSRTYSTWPGLFALQVRKCANQDQQNVTLPCMSAYVRGYHEVINKTTMLS